jgi:hypothetical protein
MNKGKQTTLFQSWGSNANKGACTSVSAALSNEVINLSDIDDEDDEILACVSLFKYIYYQQYGC